MRWPTGFARSVPHCQTQAAVDTAPVMEKELAARAGIGWVGKNTCIINPRVGSWLLLGEIITTLKLPADEPAVDRCGTCRRCIEACPTGAITAPYQLDARRCISYLTIEHRGKIPPEFHKAIGEWLYGCDICQDVCPWNRKAPAATDPGVSAEICDGNDSAGGCAVVERKRIIDRELRDSAMRRVKLPVLQRNAKIVKENSSARNGG